MGNQLAPPSKQGVETQGELLNVVVKETLGGGRFLKSLLCLHDNGGLVVVKVFYKRKDATSLVPYKQQLQEIRDALLGLQCPHVWPMQLWWETPNAGYMMRQHFFANLYDRLSTRPFLTALEKRWITFQLLHGLSQAHAHGVCHGDIKCENVMVTSWNWLFLTDFASYKPTYLPADNPADFSYYFDTGSRRRCYLAPERFFEGSPAAINTAAPLQPDMDVFSLGCVIAELWLDGRAFFDLSRLLAYRRGEHDPTQALAGVAPDVAELIMHMIQRAPGDRWSADHYLTSWPRQLFPAHFSEVLHPFFNTLLDLDPDARLAAVAAHYEELVAAITQGGGGSEEAGLLISAGQAGRVPSSPSQGATAAAAQATSTTARTPASPLQGTSSAAAVAAPRVTVALPAAAAAAAGSELLAEVNSLLADVGSAQRRLGAAAGGAAAAAEDDGICIDEEDSGPTAAAWPAPPPSLLAPEPAESNVAVEEWFEHQARTGGNLWVPEQPVSSSGRSGSKEDVLLPPGWRWAADWQLQDAAAGSSTEGWQYATSSSTAAWGSEGSSDDATHRRRLWLRPRLAIGQTASPAELAAALTAAAAAAAAASTAAPTVEAATGAAAAGAELMPVALSGGVGVVPSATAAAASSAGSKDQGMVLLAVLLCTLLRGSKLQESKRAAIMLLFRSSLLCDGEVRLQTIVPYLLTQLSDANASVRTLALRCVVQLMASLPKLPPADAKVYHDFLLPSLSLLPNDPEEVVRVGYALAVAHLAAAAHEHLLSMQFSSTQQQQYNGGSSGSLAGMADEAAAAAARAGGLSKGSNARQLEGQTSTAGRGAGSSTGGTGSTAEDQAAAAAAAPGTRDSGSGEASAAAAAAAAAGSSQATPTAAAAATTVQPLVRYDAEMAAVRSAVEKVVLELVTGTRSSADIKRGLLSHAHQLGLFFGRRDINDLLLPLLITCLNAGEWQLRGAFFGAIAAVGPHTGRDSLDVFLLPCLEQALVDGETAVVCDAVRCLASTCGHLRKRSLLAAAGKVAPLLRHHSAAVRHSAVAFIAAAARALPAADVYTQLAVMVAGMLQQQPLLLTDEEHLAACLHPFGEAAWSRSDSSRTASTQLQQPSLLGPSGAQSSRLAAPGAAPAIAEDVAQSDGSSRRSTADRMAAGGGSAAAGSTMQLQLQQQQVAGVGRGMEHGPFGNLLLPPEPVAAVRRTTSEKQGRPGGPGALGTTLSPLSPRYLDSDLNLEGSELMLRPSAPIYCLDLDPAALGSSTASTGSTVGSTTAAAAAGPELEGSKGASELSFSGLSASGSRRGYRLQGYSTASGSSSSTAASRRAAVAGSLPQNATVVPGLLTPAIGPGAAVCTADTASAAAQPGSFWQGLPAGNSSARVSCAGGFSIPGSTSGKGLLTGLSSGLGVGPGGLVVGPTAAGCGVGLRPRPKSSHTAAVESIGRRQAALQDRYNVLAEQLATDPAGLEAGDRQQLERLAATLHRLNLRPGCDVRCPAALLTHKMAAITSRAGPAGVAAGAAGDTSAPAVFDAVSAAISTGIGQHLPGPSLEGGAGGAAGAAGGPSWRPRGVLASHLMEHRAAVNCLATTANGAILLSGSDDETVKVWDVRRLERDVSFASRLTYAGQSGRITGLCPVLDGSSVASASSSGSLHVWRVEYSSKPGGWAPDKYRGITAVRQLSPGEGSILQVVPWGGHPALLLYASQRGGVHCCDLRCPADVWHVPASPSLGLATQLVADPSGQHWLAQGTSRGWVCLWDVRYLLCVNSWQHPQRCAIDAMSLAVASPQRLGLSQGSLPHPGVPLLYMSAGLQEVGLWDVLDGCCHQVLRVLDRQESQLNNPEPPGALQPPLPAAAARSKAAAGPPSWGAAAPHPAAAPLGLTQQLVQSAAAGGAAAQSGSPHGSSGSQHHGIDVNLMASELTGRLAVDQINSPQARLAGVTALLPLSGGALLAGGADRCVRYWDGSWPERSYIVAGPVWPDDTGIMDPNTNKLQVPSHVYRYSKRMYSGVPVLEERCVGDGPRLVTPDSSPDLGSKLRMHELVHADAITQLLAVDGAAKLLVSASRDGCIKVWK